jgi:TRAP-type C4-dicarboxylate transport system permease large subunit
VQAYGMHPVHFGVVLLLNLGIGLLTPPVGTALFTGCAVGKVSLEEVTKNLIYFLPAMIVVLLIITYWPTLVLFLPRLLGLIK